MLQPLYILAIFVFTALCATVFWFAYDLAADDGEEDTFPGNAPDRTTDRCASLLALDVGDPVVVRGEAAGAMDRIVRPVTDADRRHLWVAGLKFSRFDGWQADSRGAETELSWIEPQSD